MDRREVMKSLAAMFGADLLLPIRIAISQNFDPIDFSGGTLFSELQKNQISAAAETIIPETDTPGAKAANVVNFIEVMLQEWYQMDDQKRFLQGVNSLRKYCLQKYNQNFSSLSQNQQIATMSLLQDGKATIFPDGGCEFFNHIKQLTIFGYYTSEIGMTIERKYLPVPGHYDGSYPYDKVKTLFTS